VEYDGEPKFEPIEDTKLTYASNTATPVIAAGGKYYAVDEAVWFVAAKPTGSWAVAIEVPDEIYTIPVKSPLYYVTFVRIYGYTPEVVYVGYTQGYTNVYVYNNTIVYGTGYWYPGWYGRYYYLTVMALSPFTLVVGVGIAVDGGDRAAIVPIATAIAMVAVRATGPVIGQASAILHATICIARSATKPALRQSIAKTDRKPSREPPPVAPIMSTPIAMVTCIATRTRAGSSGQTRAGAKMQPRTNREVRRAVSNRKRNSKVASKSKSVLAVAPISSG